MTAVDWLLYQIEHNDEWYGYLGKQEIKKKARDMMHQQIIDAHNTGMFLPAANGFEYFKETYPTSDKKNG
jgi:hypothetical protein